MDARPMLRGLKWSVGGRGVSQALTWVLSLITIRLLAPADFGLVALCETVLIFITYSNELGLGAAIIQNERMSRQEIDAIGSFCVLWNGALYVLLFVIAPFAADFYRAPALTDVLRTLGLNLMVLSFAVVPRSLLIRDMRFRGVTLVKAGAGVAGGLTTVAAAYAGYGVWALVVGSLLLSVLETTGYHWVLRTWPRLGAAFGTLRAHFRFGAAVNQVVFAGFARIKDDRDAVGRFFIRGMGILCFASFPVFFGISAVAESLVLTLFGPGWEGSVLVIQLMALVGPLRLANTVAIEILNALGAAHANLQQVTLTGGLVVAGIAIGVWWGIAGLCVGWLAGYLAGTLLHVRCLGQRIAIDRQEAGRIVLRPLLGCLAMYLAVSGVLALLAGQAASLRLAAGIAAGAGIYGAWALLFLRAELSALRAVAKGSS